MSDSNHELRARAEAYEPPKILHPIAELAWDLYAAGGNAFDAESITFLQDAMDELKLGAFEPLADAVYSLSTFVWMANERMNDPQAADVVSEVIRSAQPQYIALLEAVAETLNDASTRPPDKFSAPFLHRAVQPDEPAPDGALPAHTLKPVARRPVHLRGPRLVQVTQNGELD